MSQQYPGHQPPSYPPAPGPYGPPPRKKLSTGAVIALALGGVFVFLVALGAVVGDGDAEKDEAGGRSDAKAVASPATTSPAVEPPATPAARPKETPPEEKEESETGRLPDFVGMGLQSAQDKAQELDFFRLTSHDALGRERNQFSDRNWKVCFQSPRPGVHPTDTEVDFGTVKLDETCPASDRGGEVAEATDTMPDFTGKSANVAREALDSSTSLSVEDASGEDRFVLVESNWKVCSQQPSAGTALNGQPVTLRVVKFEESC
ncbi:PASTA domain-containing protein [Streptomyces sp. NPDC002454]